MNPFVCDRYVEGEASWSPFRRDILQNLEAAARSADYGGGFAGPGRVIQVRARRAGMGKTHLVNRLVEALHEEFEVIRLQLQPRNLRDWERSWAKGLPLAGEGRRRRLFVADHLDGFYGDPAAGIRIARLLEHLAQTYPRSVIVLSLNRDIWRSLFLSQLPGALLDLLSWEVQDLPAITAEQAEGLVIHRMERAGLADHVILQFLEQLDLGKQLADAGQKGLSPREVFRRARSEWQTFADEEEEIERTTIPWTLTGTEGAVAAVEPFPVADQARRHLHTVAEALRRQSGPPPEPDQSSFGSSVLRLLEAPGSKETGAAKEPPDLRAAPGTEREPSLGKRFHEARRSFLKRQDLAYRPEPVCELLCRVGESFPSIQQRVLGGELSVAERVIEWTWFGRRLWMGMAPLSAHEMWDRTRRAWREVEGKGEGAKLVGFRDSGSGSIAEEMEIDVVELSPDLLANLLAAGELLKSLPEINFEGGNELPITKFLADELDHFWSLLTRSPRHQSGVQSEVNQTT